MNRLLYRIVFNKARGMLMVVADIARACCASPTGGVGHTHARLIAKVGAVSFALWLATGAIQTVQASIVADKSAPRQQQPTVLVSANGTPQINIQTPTSGGVSRNTFSQFDVDAKGAILNNSRQNTSTQTGGMIAGNPWLAKGEAKIILSEVNARDPSQLNGYIEVAGRKAQVVIASPSGITCDGCGFINASRATLTTGTAQMQDGKVTGYQVERGEITIGGKGLDATRQDHTDIIARAVKVNAAIHANDLRVTTGRNRVDAAHEQSTALTGDGGEKPQLAVDVSQVGGMYAGKIRLRGTEQGVGVRNAGHIGSEAGLVTITADGHIENSGTLWSAQDVTLSTPTSIHNSGTIAARNNVTLSATQLTSTATGTLAAGVMPDGKTGNSGDLKLAASGNLTINGLNVAGGDLHASGQGVDASGSRTRAKNITLKAGQKALSTANAAVIADNTLYASTEGSLNNNGGQLAAHTLQLSAHRLQNKQGKIVQSGSQALTLDHKDGIDNRQGTIAANAVDLSLAASELDNRDGEIRHAGNGSLTITSASYLGDGGRITSAGALRLGGQNLVLDGSSTVADNIRINAENLSVRNALLLQSGGGTLALDVRQSTDNRGGLIAANGDVALNTANLINQQGRILAAKASSLEVNASGQIDNREGTLAAARDLTLTANEISNDKGQIAAEEGHVTLSSKTALDNAAGNIVAGQRLDITANGLDSRQGQLSGETVSLSLGNANLNNQKGTIAAHKQLTISSGELNNKEGSLLSSGDMVLSAAGESDNQDGQITAGQTLNITTQKMLNNNGGRLRSGGDMRLDTQGNTLSNLDTKTAGGIISFGKLDVAAGVLANQNGLFAGMQETTLRLTTLNNRDGTGISESTLSLEAQSVDNQQGRIAALSNFTLTAGTLNNNNGGLVQSGKNLMVTAEKIDNVDHAGVGGMTSEGDMRLTASALLNDRGLLLSGQQAALDVTRFSNVSGTLAAQAALTLTTRSDVNNQGGLIQGNGITLNTDNHLLNNQHGTIHSLAALQLATAVLNNQQGTLGAKDDLSLNVTQLDNSDGGLIIGEKNAAFILGNLNNGNGQIQSAGALTINALAGVISNICGLIRSGETVTLNALSLVNRDTQAAEKGIEGQNVTITSRELDNAVGSLLAARDLSITSAKTLNNARGELTAGATLTLRGKELNLINTAGAVKAGQQIDIQADRLSGDGRLLSPGKIALHSRQDIVNSGEIAANGNITLTTPGRLTNNGKLLSGATLDLTTGHLFNTAAGEITAVDNRLAVSNTITNYGLIDGNKTRLKAAMLTNAGTGRIYGDEVAVQAGTLNNLAERGKAAVIAGRERLDIGASTVNNYDHGLIYSAGQMALGSALDENDRAIGQARVVNNHSSTIESAGNMSLSVVQLNNINDHFTTETVVVSTEQITEYQHKGSLNRWNANQEGVFVDRNSADKLRNLNTPEDTGHNNDNFYEYSYSRTIEEEVIKESDPAKILSGGHLFIHADHVLNDKSQIVAGGILGLAQDALKNVMSDGNRRITDAGTVTHFSRKSKKGKDKQNKKQSDYAPPEVIQSISLKPWRIESHAQITGSGIQLAPAIQHRTNATINAPGNLSPGLKKRDMDPDHSTITANNPLYITDERPSFAPVTPPPGQWFEIPVNAAPESVVRMVGPDTRLPDNSLFRTHPQPGATYLVETDPRFTNNKKWLSSDYMQSAFTANHDNMHKRLGDGYYEQRLIREQIIALTGGRYTGGHRNDEAQFRALMDAGIAFGKRYDLIPGVALSADQMRLLTTDIVWLVNTRVQLADGSWQTVMVPQVYVRVKPGDIDGSGALLGGQNVVMNLNSDLLNSGTIGGREVVQISAENIINKAGTIQGADISLLARLDIHNTGGDISAAHSLLASAGRDINVESVTRSAQNSSGKNTFTRINIERVGGIYVQGEDGKLSLSAGRDINLTGAQVAHTGKQGQTFLSAGQDLNLNTVTTSASDSLVWNSRNWMKHAVTQQTGTDITAAGLVQMAAGNDVNAQAARVSAGDILAVAAGRDINITAATDHSEFEARHKYSSRSGAFSKTTTRTHDALSRDSAQGSRFSGDSVAMQAGNDLWVQGSDIAGERGVNLSAAHDISTAAATETASHFHSKKTKKSGISSGGSGFSFTVGSTSTKSTHKGGETTQSESRSTIGAAAGNVVISAGNKAILSATDVVAGRAQDDTQRKTGHIDITADHIGLFPGQDSITRSVQQETKSSGLTLTLKAPFEDTVRNVHDALRGKDSGGNSTVDKVKSLAAEGVALTMDGAGSPFAVSVGRSQSSSASHYQGEFRHGSHLRAAGNIQMNAGDITAEGGKLQAGEAVILDAERDIHITASTDQENRSSKNNHSGWSLSSSMPTAGSAVRATSGGGKHASQLLPGGMSHSDSQSSGASSTQAPAVIEGSDIYLNSQKGDISISGSRLFADNDLFLSATQGNIRTQAGQQRSQYQASGGNRSVGSLGGDGYSATAGYSRETWRNHEEAQLGNSLRSTLTSAHGNVVAQAGSDISLSGTDVLAGKSLSVSGQNVDLGVSRDTRSADSRHNSEQYGVTASAGGWAVDAAKSAEHAARSVENDDDPRLAAIRAGQAAATATQGALSDSAVVKARASVTAGRSAQNSTSQSTQAQGTTLTAREDVTISARQDISGQGAGIHGRRVALEAGRDIRFDASRNTQHHESRSQGSQAGIGIGVGLIGAQNGISIEAGASRQSSRAQADALTHHNSVIRADELLTVNSGRDTTLSGTRLAGDRVVMQTGRDLTVSSLPDTASSDSRQRASGAAVSLCIPPLCYGASSGNLTASGENIDHRAQSVAEQSAILAGRGGFDIRVGGHTQLDGALIASTAAPAKNRLDTATLGWADIRNDSKTSGDSYSLALSASAGGNNRNLSPATGTGHADQAHSGITSSAISQGDIVIRDNARQTQDIASLSRDTDNTHQRVDIHGDVQKVRDNLAVQSEGMASGLSALDAWGKYTQQQAQQENAALASRLASEGTLDGMDTVQREALLKSHPDYRSTDYGPGSAFHTQGSAAIGLLAGAFGGNIQAGAAAGAAPLLASLVKNVDNATARAALHGMVAAALTQMKGGSAKDGMAAGAAGAATASLLAERLVGALYGKPVDQLTADEKRLVSSLVTLAGAGAGYTAGGDISLAATGADSARVEVENNTLAHVLAAAEKEKPGTIAKYQAAREAMCQQDPEACRQAVNEAASLGLDFVPVIGDIKGFHEAETALDYLAAAIGLIPGAGDVAGKTIKAAEKALKNGDVEAASKLIKQASDDIQVKWVDENAGMSQRARDYNDSAAGARSNIDTQKGQAPTIDRIDVDGNSRPVRFDGVDSNTMIDRKISIVTTQKAKNQALRQSEALKNNGMTGRWEVPNQTQANRAQKMFDELGIKNIEVKIVKE